MIRRTADLDLILLSGRNVDQIGLIDVASRSDMFRTSASLVSLGIGTRLDLSGEGFLIGMIGGVDLVDLHCERRSIGKGGMVDWDREREHCSRARKNSVDFSLEEGRVEKVGGSEEMFKWHKYEKQYNRVRWRH